MKTPHAAVFLSTLFIAGIAIAQTPLTGPNPSWTQLNPVTRLSADTFAHPPLNDRPWVRVNTPDQLTSEELQAEIAEMAAHGIGGLEIGQGTFPATPQLVAILQAANQHGLKVSLSHGSTTAPKGYSYNEDNVRKTLLFTASKLASGQTSDITFKAPLPPVNRGFGGGGGNAAAAPPPPRRSSLIAVLAYRCASASCEDNGPITLDPASVKDLTSTLTQTDKAGVAGAPTTGHLAWTAPDSGAWQIIALWSQGAQIQPDLFSKAGTDELIHGMESDWTPEVKSLLRQNGGDIFYDSHSSDRGSPTELWTNNMEAEFKARRGYSLIQSAPALFPQNFTFSDGSAARVRNDLNAVRTSLWIENHLKPMKDWAHTYNLRLRLQPYGEVVAATPDEIEAASILDRPETESLFFGDEVDSFLPIASANHMTGNTWYSTECCAALSKAYAQTFQDAVIRMHREYVAGVTRIVYHVYPYRDAANMKWPGYHSFGPAGFSNAWGPRNPFWIDANTYNDYFARTQQALTQGTAKVDVAVYMLSYAFPQPMQVKAGFHIWPDTKLQEAGFSRDYLDPALLALPDATVTNGRLATSKAAYKVLILDSEQQPTVNPEKNTMPLETARKVLALAKSGLPIVIVGPAPDQTPGRTPADDAAVKSTMAELLKQKSVHQVQHESDVPALLLSLNIHPAMEPAKPSPVLSLQRSDATRGITYFFLYNQEQVTPPGEPGNLFEPAGTKPFDGAITLHGQGKPYLLDAWSGSISPIREYKQTPDGVTLTIHLAADDAAIIALSTAPLSSSMEGTNRITQATGASTPKDLTSARWHLSVEDWKPAASYGSTGPQASETKKDTVQLDLDTLKPWTEIPELKNVSGIGTYTSSIDLANWKPGANATLHLGEVFDSFQLTVNGRVVPINQISAAADIGKYLKPGSNTLQVRVATTLNNRLSDLDPDVKKRNLIQRYGLIGPVTLETASN
jgi:hypothetical protein